MRHIALMLATLLLWAASALAEPLPVFGPAAGWDVMPAGSRSTYMGIHGGTMPVSLLVSSEGDALVTFVGQTGNDFLTVLRQKITRLPSLFNSTRFGHNATGSGASLMAGSASMSLPVVYMDGKNDLAGVILRPFGLSDKPLSIEGAAMRPLDFPPSKSYRMFFEPAHLQPRRVAN